MPVDSLMNLSSDGKFEFALYSMEFMHFLLEHTISLYSIFVTCLCFSVFGFTPFYVISNQNKRLNKFFFNSVIHLDVILTVNVAIDFYSIRVFSIAAVICTVLVLPVNYYGKERIHKDIPLESLEVFTIENVKTGSRL